MDFVRFFFAGWKWLAGMIQRNTATTYSGMNSKCLKRRKEKSVLLSFFFPRVCVKQSFHDCPDAMIPIMPFFRAEGHMQDRDLVDHSNHRILQKGKRCIPRMNSQDHTNQTRARFVLFLIFWNVHDSSFGILQPGTNFLQISDQGSTAKGLQSSGMRPLQIWQFVYPTVP